MLERVGYLKEREEVIGVRKIDPNTEHGCVVVNESLNAIVSRRIYQTESTGFVKGTISLMSVKSSMLLMSKEF